MFLTVLYSQLCFALHIWCYRNAHQTSLSSKQKPFCSQHYLFHQIFLLIRLRWQQAKEGSPDVSVPGARDPDHEYHKQNWWQGMFPENVFVFVQRRWTELSMKLEKDQSARHYCPSTLEGHGCTPSLRPQSRCRANSHDAPSNPARVKSWPTLLRPGRNPHCSSGITGLIINQIVIASFPASWNKPFLEGSAMW